MATNQIPTTMRSTEAETDRPLRLLGVWAHPDDEAYLSAGLMARVVEAGGEVTVLTATLGELGFAEDDPRSLRERAEFRENEMRAAMGEIGVEDVRFLRWLDGAIDVVPEKLAVRRIASVIVNVQPDIIVTFGPDGITGHPDHISISKATTAAWHSTGIGELYYATSTTTWLDRYRDLHERLGVFMGPEPEGTHPSGLAHHVRLSDQELDRKRAVLAHHASQTGGVAEAMGQDLYREWTRDEFFRSPTPAEIAGLARTAAVPEDDYLWSEAWLTLTRELATAA